MDSKVTQNNDETIISREDEEELHRICSKVFDKIRASGRIQGFQIRYYKKDQQLSIRSCGSLRGSYSYFNSDFKTE